MTRVHLLSSAAVLCLALTGGAHAATLASYSTTLPADMYVVPTTTSGTVLTSVTGTVTNQYVSPFGDSTSPYVAVQNGSATYDLAGSFLSFVFGSPDTWNTVSFLNGGSVFDSFTIGGTPLSNGVGAFVTLQASGHFDAVQFSSSQAALEFSNVSVSAVPLPASAPLFGAALVALGMAGYGLKRKKAAAAAA